MTNATYLIAHTQRTGSNWLCDVLAHTGMAGIGNVERCGLFIGYGVGIRANYQRALDDYFRGSTTPNGVCGMKTDWDYLTDHLGAHLPAGAVSEILDRYTHFIYLQRWDRIAQAVSWQIAGVSGVFNTLPKPDAPPVHPNSVPYDFKAIQTNLAKLEAAHQRWLDWFAAHDIQPLTLTYEDWSQDIAATVRRIFDFLGIEAADIPIHYTLQKQHNPNKAAYAERFRSEMVNA